MQRRHRLFMGFAALVAACALVAGFMATSLTTGRVSAEEGEAHPVHIHKGTCAALGDVVFPLTDIAVAGPGTATPEMEMTEMESSPMAGMASTPSADDEEYGDPAGTSVTTVSAKLDDIIAGGHAINAHESKDQIQNYIACGDITGTATDGELKVELAELNDSGYTGEAELKDNGDGTTTVSIELYEKASEGTPAASASGNTVEIKNFAFGPDTLEVAVGTTVTWTNNDEAPHTVTQDGGGFQSGKIASGATFSYTFDTAGSFTYHCEFHANMKATVVVK